MTKTLTMYSGWAWAGILPNNPKNNRIDTAYLDWLESRYLYVDIYPLLDNVNASISTKKQIDKLYADMLENKYPETYVLNHPVSRTLKGRNYAFNLLNTKLDKTDKQLFDKFFCNLSNS